MCHMLYGWHTYVQSYYGITSQTSWRSVQAPETSKSKVKLLGHFVSDKGIEADSDKTRAIREYKGQE